MFRVRVQERTTAMAAFEEGVPCWADVTLDDLEAGKRFYAALFGWTFQDVGERFGHYTRARLGGRSAAGLVPKPDGRMPTAWGVYFAAHDAAATGRRITEAGGRIITERATIADLGTVLTAADPAGAVFGVWQAGSHTGFEVTDEPGSYCWAEVYTRGKEEVDPFYTGVFRLRCKEIGDAREFDFAVFSPGGADIGDLGVMGRFQMGEGFPAELPAHFLVYFAVENCDEAAQRAGSLGGRVTMGPQDSPFGRWAVVTDDQGAAFAVLDRTTTVGERPT